MKIYFTADCHFGHANIIKYTNRPFSNIDEMNNEIVKRWNQKVKQDDLVYHVGDFAFKGNRTAQEWEKKLHGKIVHICGNHDYNNGVKSFIQSAIMQFGGLEVVVQHHPPTMIAEIPDYVDMVICGHIHNKWKYKFLEEIPTVPIVNVGVDVWQFTPISVDSIIKYYKELMRMQK